MLDYQITDKEKFKDIDVVDLEGLYKMEFQGRVTYEGNLRLHMKDNTDKNISGEFSPKDFENEYGFKIKGQY